MKYKRDAFEWHKKAAWYILGKLIALFVLTFLIKEVIYYARLYLLYDMYDSDKTGDLVYL